MILRRHRLSNDKQIKKVLQKGATRTGSFFRIKALKNPRLLDISRFNVVISKKVASRATVRNKIRRRTKAIFIEEIAKIKGYDLVVFPKLQVEGADFKKLTEDGEKCLRELVSAL